FPRWRKSSRPSKHSLDFGPAETKPCVVYAQLLKTLCLARGAFSGGSAEACQMAGALQWELEASSMTKGAEDWLGADLWSRCRVALASRLRAQSSHRCPQAPYLRLDPDVHIGTSE